MNKHLDPRSVGIIMPLAQQQGGAEALLMHLLRCGSKDYNFACAFLQDGPLVSQVESLGYSAKVFPSTRLTNPGNYIATVARLYKWMKQKKVSRVLSWMPKAHLYAGPAALMMGARILWFQHGVIQGNPIDHIATWIPADGILCCSGAAKAAQDALSPRRATHICYPGVTFPSLQPIDMAAARNQLRLPADLPIIGMIARWERWKGAHIFLAAAGILSATYPTAHFFIVGGAHPRDPGYADELRALAASTGLGDRLHLAGQRPAQDVPTWQAAADVVVHPVTGEEPFGMAVVEAMGMGKVVVASAVGGLVEIIHPGVDGYLVAPGEPAELATQVDDVLSHPDERRSMEDEAFARGRSFSIAAFVQRLHEVIRTTD
jgi:glycosyltransferase involved in cell wall biosynthesis